MTPAELGVALAIGGNLVAVGIAWGHLSTCVKQIQRKLDNGLCGKVDVLNERVTTLAVACEERRRTGVC